MPYKQTGGGLIDQINKLTQRSMPPTSRIVRNLAEEVKATKSGRIGRPTSLKGRKTGFKLTKVTTKYGILVREHIQLERERVYDWNGENYEKDYDV
ncbi:hypothetical protein DID88_004576 [Monilinia fructigena]|uniref:Uncharacterized protein n=1 Tax=Monilinia fructigena TaxID=38457 RepID=A0A395ITK8_9HELO|nr:hypothetical protein DID88_004576 [Monilinia fructigena]